MREMKQDNVCAFIGAYVEHNKVGPGGERVKVALVSEYCPRGSLLDILAIEDIKLNSLFISSLVHDLLRVGIIIVIVIIICSGKVFFFFYSYFLIVVLLFFLLLLYSLFVFLLLLLLCIFILRRT